MRIEDRRKIYKSLISKISELSYMLEDKSMEVCEDDFELSDILAISQNFIEVAKNILLNDGKLFSIYLKVDGKYITDDDPKNYYWRDGEKAMEFNNIELAYETMRALVINGFNASIEIRCDNLEVLNPVK